MISNVQYKVTVIFWNVQVNQKTIYILMDSFFWIFFWVFVKLYTDCTIVIPKWLLTIQKHFDCSAHLLMILDNLHGSILINLIVFFVKEFFVSLDSVTTEIVWLNLVMSKKWFRWALPDQKISGFISINDLVPWNPNNSDAVFRTNTLSLCILSSNLINLL